VIEVAKDRKREIGKPNTWHWKVVDTDLSTSPDDPPDNGGRTIAVAIWSAHNIPTTKVDGSSDPTSLPIEKAERNDEQPPFIPPEVRLDVLNAVLTPLRKAKTEIMGSKPYLMLNSLATHPEHHHKGAGSMLLEWGLRKADEDGLDIYLDSSRLAKPLYEREGFEVMREIEFDRRPWGGEGIDWHGCMVRKPKAAGSHV